MSIVGKILQSAPSFRLVCPFIIGIILAWQGKDILGNLWIYSAIGCLLVFLLLIPCLRHRKTDSKPYFEILFFTFWAFLGASLSLRVWKSTQVQWPQQEKVWRGVVTQLHKAERQTRRVEVTLASGQKVMIGTFSNQPLALGQEILFFAQIESPRNQGNPCEIDYSTYWKRQGIAGQAFVGNHLEVVAEGNRQIQPSLFQKLKIIARRCQQTLASKFDQLKSSASERAILQAITLGYRENVDSGMRQMFSQSGVSHILALSGLHLGILTSLLFFLLTPLRITQVGRCCFVGILLLFIWGFTWLTGSSISLQRAAVMYSIFLVFNLRESQGVPLNHLGIAAFCILLLRPLALFDIGFQLSFLSVFFILFLRPYYKPVRKQIRHFRWFVDFLYVSLVAQMAVAPLVAYDFHTLPIFFLLSNILVIPCTYLLLGGSMLYLLGFAFEPFHTWIGLLLESTVRLMERGMSAIVHLPWCSVTVAPSWFSVLLCYVALLLTIGVLEKSNRRNMLLAVVCWALIPLAIAFDHRFNRIKPQIVCFNFPACPVVQGVYSAEKQFLWFPDSLQTAEKALKLTQRFRECNHLPVPPILQQDILEFGGKRLVMIHDNRWKKKSAPMPLPVDALYISRGCDTPLPQLAQLFAPKVIIFHANVYPKLKQKYISDAKRLKLNYYDLRRQGAYIMSI